MSAALQRIKPYEAKKALTTLLNKVAYGKKPVILESRGHDLAVLISMDHFRIFQELLARKEDEEDWAEMEASLADSEGESIDWETLKDELNLSNQVPPKIRKAAQKAGTRRSNVVAGGHRQARR